MNEMKQPGSINTKNRSAIQNSSKGISGERKKLSRKERTKLEFKNCREAGFSSDSDDTEELLNMPRVINSSKKNKKNMQDTPNLKGMSISRVRYMPNELTEGEAGHIKDFSEAYSEFSEEETPEIGEITVEKGQKGHTPSFHLFKKDMSVKMFIRRIHDVIGSMFTIRPADNYLQVNIRQT